MSYWRFIVKCFFTFVVFPLVFATPCVVANLPFIAESISRPLMQSTFGPDFRFRDVSEYLRYIPLIALFTLAFIIWATLTYLMWFRVPNRPTNRPQK